jgi:hypothetical protein
MYVRRTQLNRRYGFHDGVLQISPTPGSASRIFCDGISSSCDVHGSYEHLHDPRAQLDSVSFIWHVTSKLCMAASQWVVDM